MAEVGVLEVHEEALVQAAEGEGRVPPDHQAGARDPVDRERARRPRARGPRGTGGTIGCEGRARVSGDRRPSRAADGRRERAGRALIGAVGLSSSGATTPTSGCCVELGDHRVDRRPAATSVSGLSSSTMRPRGADAGVDRPGEAGVVAHLDHDGATGWVATDDGDAVVARRVVGHHQLDRVVDDGGDDRVEARLDEVRALVGDDEHRDVGPVGGSRRRALGRQRAA